MEWVTISLNDGEKFVCSAKDGHHPPGQKRRNGRKGRNGHNGRNGCVRRNGRIGRGGPKGRNEHVGRNGHNERNGHTGRNGRNGPLDHVILLLPPEQAYSKVYDFKVSGYSNSD